MRRITNNSNTSTLLGLARRALGLFCLVIFALGAVLPIIPGWPALIFAVALLGRRDRTLRKMHLTGRRGLRWLRGHQFTRVSDAGRWLSSQYVTARRAITPAITRAERALQF